jgi:hypothetical protein
VEVLESELEVFHIPEAVGLALHGLDFVIEAWWTDLEMAAEDVIELYRQHANSEQFHSEFKTDLDLERQVRHQCPGDGFRRFCLQNPPFYWPNGRLIAPF